MEVINSIKRILSFTYFGLVNYVRYKNFSQEYLDMKDRLNSYNMKYPETRRFNNIMLENPMIYFYLLIINFIMILSSAFFGIKRFGVCCVLFFILTEYYLFNDVLIGNIYKFSPQKFANLEDVIQLIPNELVLVVCVILGILTVSTN